MKHKNCYLLLLFFALLFNVAARAQETSGGLTGKVVDAKGLPLPGATVLAVHEPSGTRYATATGTNGNYNLPGLRIGGPYTIEVKAIGMTSQKNDNITVSLGASLTVNFILSDNVKQLNEVTVKAARTGVRANRFGAGQNISREQIRNAPTISRSLQDITRQVPQASKDNSFAGTNFRYNNVTIDGAINNDAIGFSPSLGGITGTSGQPGSSTRTNPFTLDAIEDIQVYLAPYDVKIGNFTGGSINAVTRSGANQLHGSVYAYGRNASVTGPDNVASGGKLPSDFYDYQTGIRLGFPIVKNKLFLFTNEEIARRQDPIQQGAGSEASAQILSLEDAEKIRNYTLQKYGFDPGEYGQVNVTSRSNKFFNRIDWNIDDRNQLSVRNNTITSQAVNLERDQQDFRFGSIAYKQFNNQSSTVAELKSRFNNQLSNSLIIGYTSIHDYRNPSSDPSFPQVQIVGRTPGTTIFFGTDREASIFDQKQKTFEISDNFNWNLGRHNLLLGTHNEFYRINYGFVNSWNGRVDYPSIEDFLNNNPSRVRGSYNYDNNNRDYIISHPSAVFNVNLLSLYAQDEISITDKFKITPGLRFDYAEVPTKQVLSDKTRNSPTDPYAGTTYDATPLNKITQNYFGRVQVSPRLGFRFEWLTGEQSLTLRGGIGMFTGRIPFAWLGYAFYNTGDSYGAFDQRYDNGQNQVAPGSDPLRAGQSGIAGYAAQNGQVVNNRNAGKTQVDLVDNDFTMPKVLRSSFAVDFTDNNGFKYSVEGIYTKTVKDVKFVQVNITDNPTYFTRYDDLLQRQPVFPGAVDPKFTNVYELTNTSQGYRYSLTGQVSKVFLFGLSASVAYTYGQSKDISNGIRNSMESNFQLNQALNPNDPQLANSNFDIRNRIVSNVSYNVAWNKNWKTTFSLFLSAQSGSPFTYGFVNYTFQNTGQQVQLAYIPYRNEAVNFFPASYTDPATGLTQTDAQQAAAFNKFIDENKYLSSRRGNFTERNKGRTPWNTQLDFHFQHDFGFSGKLKGHSLTFSADIINLTNLLNKNWGHAYFSPNTFNSTASVGLLPYIPNRATDYPLFQFKDPGTPYAVDQFNSRYQLQFGLRYSF